MRHAIEWTSGMEAVLCRMRIEGQTWAAIGASVGVGREAAREHGRRIGARRMPMPRRDERLDRDERNRPPLPAGHPVTWNLLNAGTCIEGCAYPYPVFL